MTGFEKEQAREAATRLFQKMTREKKDSVSTIGIGESSRGNAVLIPYLRDRDVPTPEFFEGYSVLPLNMPESRRGH